MEEKKVFVPEWNEVAKNHPYTTEQKAEDKTIELRIYEAEMENVYA